MNYLKEADAVLAGLGIHPDNRAHYDSTVYDDCRGVAALAVIENRSLSKAARADKATMAVLASNERTGLMGPGGPETLSLDEIAGVSTLGEMLEGPWNYER